MFVANLKWQHNGPLIPSSSPNKYHERNLHICRHLKEYLFCIRGKISNVCIKEVGLY